MLFKQFVIVSLILLSPLVSQTADITRQDINNVLQAAEDLKENMQVSLPDNRDAAAAAGKAARDFNSPETRRRINNETRRLKETIFAETLENNPDLPNPESLTDDNGRIYVFISSSMPMQTLKNYAADIDSLAPHNITVVLRGFVNGMKLFAPTRDFISEILTKDSACELSRDQCEAYRVSFEIHPELFQQMQITEVPAFAYVRNENETYLVHGDISLSGGLEKIQQSARSTYLAKTIKKLKGGYYDYN